MFTIPSDEVGIETATLAALRDFRDVCLGGWGMAGGSLRVPDQVWVDSGWAESQMVVYAFVRESGDRFRPTKGHGQSQDNRGRYYTRPQRRTAEIIHIGDHYHAARQKADRVHLIEIDADYWKTWVHRRLSTATDSPGAMTFYHAMPQEHRTLSHHLTAEKQVEEFVAGKGSVIRWVRVRHSNHWLDCLYAASAAGHLCGARLIQTAAPVEQRIAVQQKTTGFRTPDGRAFLATERKD